MPAWPWSSSKPRCCATRSTIHSLRGAICAAQLLDIANEQTSEWIQTAIFTDRDPEWHDYFQVQRSRVDGRLEMERRAGRP